MKYNRQSYNQYRKRMLKNGCTENELISFKTWKFIQPIADKTVENINLNW